VICGKKALPSTLPVAASSTSFSTRNIKTRFAFDFASADAAEAALESTL